MTLVYIRTFERLGQALNYHLPLPGSPDGLGYASPPGLVLLKHFHVPVEKGLAISLPTQMRSENMDPWYQPKNDSLQQGLHSVLKQDPFRNFLVDKTATRAHASDRIRVALVDLSGRKLFNPVFAGYGSTVPMGAASLAKILALYGTFQLRFDLWYLAHSSKPQMSKKDDLIRASVKAGYPGKNGELPELFDFKEVPGRPVEVEFTSAALDHLKKSVGSARHVCGCCSNGSATWLIHHLGYPYMASLAWQSGLRHPAKKGLWLRRDYGTLAECQANEGRWTPLPGGKRRPEAKWPPEWVSNPLKDTFPHECNALSVATYFTLLAQGRLTNPWSSKALREDILTQGYEGAFGPAFPGLTISSKVGRLKPPEGFVDHQGAIIRRNRSGKNIHYVAVVLTQRVERDSGIVKSLVLKLDELVSSLN